MNIDFKICRYMKKILTVILLVTFCLSCNYFSKYKGYKKTWSGIYYKLLAIGDDDVKAQIGDYITFEISYKTLSDSVFFKGKRKFQVTKPDFKGSVDECFTMLAKGEQAEFIINSGDFFSKTLQIKQPSFLNPDNDLKVEISMLDIQTEKQYENQKKAFLKWIEDFGDYEKEIISQYMREQKLSVQPTKSGLFYLKIKPGNGRRVQKGDTLIVDYEGKFLDGKFFDSTVKRHEPFQFVYGTEWQVVKGLEEAFGLMEENEKALVILPSELAFGELGSSTGIIPPFTSLIFEVEIKKIN
jgi:FKBP-type peptidyl-prolyl cis-trans isomerase FkpA